LRRSSVHHKCPTTSKEKTQKTTNLFVANRLRLWRPGKVQVHDFECFSISGIFSILQVHAIVCPIIATFVVARVELPVVEVPMRTARAQIRIAF
jgi:hypothetical protein